MLDVMLQVDDTCEDHDVLTERHGSMVRFAGFFVPVVHRLVAGRSNSVGGATANNQCLMPAMIQRGRRVGKVSR